MLSLHISTRKQQVEPQTITSLDNPLNSKDKKPQILWQSYSVSSFKKQQEKSRAPSPIQPSSDDGATSYIAGGYYGQYLDLDGNLKTEYDSEEYREMAPHPEVDSAIEDIIHEAIVVDQNDSPVQVNLDNLEVSDSVKKSLETNLIT